MIQVRKNLVPIPQSLIEQRCIDSLNNIIRDGKIVSENKKGKDGNIIEVKNLDEKIYKGHYHKNADGLGDVQQALKDLYHNKCAYCETKLHYITIEHYRPKAGCRYYDSTERKFKDVKKTENREEIKHLGYYWLVYDWNNLVPTCSGCNDTAFAKGVKFTLLNENSRVYNHSSDISVENPHLLHPEIDNPENYLGFSFQIGNVQMIGLDNEGRGEMTIKICNLDRLNKNNTWYNHFSRYYKAIIQALVPFIEYEREDITIRLIDNVLQDLYDYINSAENSYLFLHRFIYQKFKAIFAPPILPSGVCPKLHEIYDEFYKNNPI